LLLRINHPYVGYGPTASYLLYANRQRFVMLISSNLVGCSTGKSAASLREDIELAAHGQRASERLYEPVSRGRERLMSESRRSDTFSTASGSRF